MGQEQAGDCEGRSEHVGDPAQHAVQREGAGVDGGRLRDEQHQPQQPHRGVQVRVPIDASERAGEVQGPERHRDEWHRGGDADAGGLRHGLTAQRRNARIERRARPPFYPGA
jgi:hypothetical protein